MSFRINPATPEVTQVVTPATPATVTVTLSMPEALLLAAVQGAATGSYSAPFSTLYQGLHSHPQFRDLYAVVRKAIAYDDDDAGPDARGNLSFHQYTDEITALCRAVDAGAA